MGLGTTRRQRWARLVPSHLRMASEEKAAYMNTSEKTEIKKQFLPTATCYTYGPPESFTDLRWALGQLGLLFPALKQCNPLCFLDIDSLKPPKAVKENFFFFLGIVMSVCFQLAKSNHSVTSLFRKQNQWVPGRFPSGFMKDRHSFFFFTWKEVQRLPKNWGSRTKIWVLGAWARGAGVGGGGAGEGKHGWLRGHPVVPALQGWRGEPGEVCCSRHNFFFWCACV